ncbi:MAG: hypothetical protein U5K32_03035 [Bacteroidales bacterium]|nr:hypothetical protein [Bacteroidales bacterium]
MFQFGFLSMNIVYIAFAAVYLVSFGLLSYNRLEAKKQNDNALKEDQQKTISYHSGPEDNNPSSFHYSDYFTGGPVQKQPAHQYSLNKTGVLLFHREIPDHLLCFSILSRPPPAV